MTIDPDTVLAVTCTGLIAFAGLAVVGFRAGRRRERSWQQLAASRGWRLERRPDDDPALILQGHSGKFRWHCGVHTGVSVNNPLSTSDNITRLETIWSTTLACPGLAGELSVYDNAHFRNLRRITGSRVLHVLSSLPPGEGGKLLRAGIAGANAAAIPLGNSHHAICLNTAAEQFVDPVWQAACLRFASRNRGCPLRLYLHANSLELALTGAIWQAEHLLRFFDSATELAAATEQRLRRLAHGEALEPEVALRS
jgi:hypothetical protein